MARPTDVWLHARGVPGAHVLLRRPNDEPGDVPAADLQFAANLAAWFSKVQTAVLHAALHGLYDDPDQHGKPVLEGPLLMTCLRCRLALTARSPS